MLEAKEVVKSFDGFRALDSATLTVPKGTVYGLVGPNGAGKSTIIRHFTGVYRPDSGKLLLEGAPIWENTDAKRRMVVIPDDWYYFPQASIAEMAKLYAGAYPSFSWERYEKMKQVFPLNDRQMLRRMSKGMQKQAAFWLTMCCMPEYLILDEPVDGLDPVMRRQVWSLLLGDVAERGTTVLVSSHNLRELEDVCDHVGIMNQGKVLLERSLSELQDTTVKLQVVYPGDEPRLPAELNILHHSAVGASYGTRTVSEVCQGTYSMGVIMAFVFGGVLAMALYSYLMNGRSVGLIHSLPLKRQTLFFTQLLTGFAMLTAGNLLVVLVSLLVCGELGPLLVWLAVVTLAEIFFLALGTLCAMLTGWLLAVPVLYVGINFLVMAVMQLIHWLAELFIYGYQANDFGSFTMWCTPVVQLARRLTDSQGVIAEYVGYPIVSADVSPLENGGWQALGIYVAVAVAIIALACMLCIRRRSELSGDVAAFPWMRPVLRYGVGCMGGLALGMILYSVTFGLARTNDIRAYLPGMLLCVVLMTLVCSFGMSMLLGKSLKIFRRTWKGTVLLTALLAAVCVCVRMDVAGVERRVPKTSEIESISVQCSRANSFTATSEDTETIEAIRAIHRAVLDQMKDGDVDLDGALVEDGQYIWIRLKYTLTDGSALERAYNVPVRRASALYTAINHMMSTPQVRQTLVFSGEAEAGAVPQGGTIYSLETGDFRNLTAAEAQSLYQAAWQDVEEGNVISDILTETGYTLLQVDINGRNWDCALDTRYFTDGAKTLAVLDRFMRNGWSNADGLTETTEDS